MSGATGSSSGGRGRGASPRRTVTRGAPYQLVGPGGLNTAVDTSGSSLESPLARPVFLGPPGSTGMDLDPNVRSTGGRDSPGYAAGVIFFATAAHNQNQTNIHNEQQNFDNRQYLLLQQHLPMEHLVNRVIFWFGFAFQEYNLRPFGPFSGLFHNHLQPVPLSTLFRL